MYIYNSIKFSSYNSVPTEQNSDVTLNLRKREIEMVSYVIRKFLIRNYVRTRTKIE